MGIAGSVDPSSGMNDPTMTAIGGVYTAMWNVYLNEELNTHLHLLSSIVTIKRSSNGTLIMSIQLERINHLRSLNSR